MPKSPPFVKATLRGTHTNFLDPIRNMRRLSTPGTLQYIRFPWGAEQPVTTLPSLASSMRSLRPSSTILLAVILYATQVSLALHIDFPRRSEAGLPNLLSRAPNATSALDNSHGGYFINITLGGKQFSVMIDTGR
jgi:hypothetical protein